MLPKGFLSNAWGRLYTEINTEQPFPSPISANDLLKGLIHLLWQTQMTLWDNHLKAQNHQIADTSIRVMDKTIEYKTRIRLLHDRKSQCLHIHREQYFYLDVEQFLHSATNAQMKAYLHHYEPVIQQSIKDAAKTRLRPIFTFTGTRQPRSTPTAPPLHKTTHQNHTVPTFPINNERAAFPHKHTRWKPERSLHEFFSRPGPS